MDRSFAARASIGRFTRPFAGLLPAHGLAGLLAGPRRRLAGPRRRLAGIPRRRSALIALLCMLIATPVLAGAWLWLRESSFVTVHKVEITGVHGAESAAIETALTQAARRMSTLDVHEGALLAAVAQFRVVRDVRAVPVFPHGLRLVVSEQLPVAALLVGGTRTALAADGVVLGPALLSSTLPTLGGSYEPLPGQRLHDYWLRASLTILGAAPAPLAHRVARVYLSSRGQTVAMRNGLLAYFGDATRPHAKWLSLARVLADPSSAGASYVDVRLPGRPAAGFPAGVAPPDAGTWDALESTESTGGPESAVASLAAGLGAGTSTTSTPTGAEPEKEPSSESSSAASSESSASTSPETSSAESSQATSTPVGEAAQSSPEPQG
jgi:cell division protein FtsQ